MELDEDMKNALLKYNRDKITEEEYTYLKNYTNEEINRLNGLKNSLKIKVNERISKLDALFEESKKLGIWLEVRNIFDDEYFSLWKIKGYLEDKNKA